MTTYYDASTGLEFNTTLGDINVNTGNYYENDDTYYNPRYYVNADDNMSRRYPEFTSELSYSPQMTSDNYQSRYSLNQENMRPSSGYMSTYDVNSAIPSRYTSTSEYSSYESRDPYTESTIRQPIMDIGSALRGTTSRSYSSYEPAYSSATSFNSSYADLSTPLISKSLSASYKSPPTSAPVQSHHYEREIVDDKPNDTDLYADKLCSIFSGGPTSGIPSRPSLVHSGIYVGSTSNAENLAVLKSCGITYVINCGAESLSSMKERQIRELYDSPKSTVKGYDNLPMQNNDHFPIESYLRQSSEMIDRSKKFSSGSTLICSSDVSRCGAVAMGYMLKHGVRLLEAARTLKNERHVALSNHSFIRQLVLYARSLSQLEPLSEVTAHSITRTPRSRRRNDRRSMYRDYLEMISP